MFKLSIIFEGLSVYFIWSPLYMLLQQFMYEDKVISLPQAHYNIHCPANRAHT